MKSFFTVLLLLFSVASFAQISKGDKQVQFTTSITSQVADGFSSTTGVMFLRGSQFYTDNIEVGVSLISSLSSSSFTNPFDGQTTKTSNSTLGIGVFGNYSFLSDDTKLVPYVGAQMQRLDVLTDGSPLSIGVNGGAKYFLTEIVNLDAGLNLGTAIGENSGGGVIIQFQFGIGILFPSDF